MPAVSAVAVHSYHAVRHGPYVGPLAGCPDFPLVSIVAAVCRRVEAAAGRVMWAAWQKAGRAATVLMAKQKAWLRAAQGG